MKQVFEFEHGACKYRLVKLAEREFVAGKEQINIEYIVYGHTTDRFHNSFWLQLDDSICKLMLLEMCKQSTPFNASRILPFKAFHAQDVGTFKVLPDGIYIKRTDDFGNEYFVFNTENVSHVSLLAAFLMSAEPTPLSTI